MGFTGKKKPPLQIMDNGAGGYVVDSEAKKWVIAGIGLRSPLKPIFTNPKKDLDDGDDDDNQEEFCTTPTSEDSRIICSRLSCPPAPKKRKSSSRYHHFNGVREFFSPPHDLETVFIRRIEKA